MNLKFETAYVSCGCNRVPHAADWGQNGLICFGSCNSVVIYDPTFAGEGGKITHTLHGHKERVNCVRWLRNNLGTHENCFVSASADGTAILWYWCEKSHSYLKKIVLKGHTNIVNVADGFIKRSSNYFHSFEEVSLLIATSSIDSTVRVWETSSSSDPIQCVDIIKWTSGFCLDVKLDVFPDTDVVLLACAADDNKVHIFVEHKMSEIDRVDPDHRFYKIYVLSGHDDWVRSMDFFPSGNDLYLATGSQDSYIRVYKFERRLELRSSLQSETESNSKNFELELEEKIIKVGSTFNEYRFAVILETILAGHEGWVYGVSWYPAFHMLSHESSLDQTTEIKGVLKSENLKLLSSSMDKSMIIWSPDKSGIWSEETRVGEVGGNMLGFYGGKFGPHGRSIMAHGYQGSFHIWSLDKESGNWEPKVVVGGHSSEVMDLAWDVKGNYILSVGGDQTTRLHAPWVRNEGRKITWHEIARPQIHGYDLTCLTLISEHKFASGAEEKIIRAFTAPNNFVDNFRRICDLKVDPAELKTEGLPQGASVPALGLSNKPVFEQMKREGFLVDDEYPDLYFSPIYLKKPPTEENLMQNTLWPEAQKLYGHGFEIYSLAARSDGLILSSACKATSPEQAAIILWNAKTWLQIQKLTGHSLTVTQMSFSPGGRHLLSVSRDRTWCLFGALEKKDGKLYELLANSGDSWKNFHARVIWCCCWTWDSSAFATGSRDGKIGLWAPEEGDRGRPAVKLVANLEFAKESVTALAFSPAWKGGRGIHLLAVGLESGSIFLHRFSDSSVESLNVSFRGDLGHDLAVKRLAFRPKLGMTGDRVESDEEKRSVIQLASCGSDHVVKVFDLFLG